MRILIVEDDPLMARMYGKVFGYEGFEVTTAENGKEALDLVASAQPEIILLDVMMPVMNGLDVLRNLKANPATAAIPVIMLTNLAGKSDAESALQLGALKYVIKSEHEPTEIVSLVRDVVGSTPSDQPNTAQQLPPEAPNGY